MIIDKIKEQIKNNSGRNLFYRKFEDVLEINSSFIKELQAIKNSEDLELYESEIEETITETVKLLVTEVYQINQFLNITDQKLEEAKAIYRDTWERIKQNDSVETVLYTSHYPGLSAWLSEIYPESFLVPMKKQKLINKIICKEYSPEFQMNILDLILTEIKEPLLDIGCGENANLVNYLRGQSKQAFGFDRMTKFENQYLQMKSWFDYDYGINKWGTIISNMALSNNFTYTANYEAELIDKYRSLYFKILDSLVLGGRFIYAPSFKKFEDELNLERFNLKNISISNGFYLTRIEKIAF